MKMQRKYTDEKNVKYTWNEFHTPILPAVL